MTAKKICKTISNIEDKLLLVLFIIIFLIGAYGVYDSYYVYHGAQDKSLLAYKPDGDSGDSLKDLSENAVAWITVDNTTIDYPVMQGKDNFEYLTLNPYGEYSLAGSIFLDAGNDPNFNDKYSLLYGHHMSGGHMFGALDYFLEEDYFNSHETGTLITREKTYKITFFAVMKPDTSDSAVFNIHESDNIGSFISQNALYKRNASGNKIIALSTCSEESTTARTVLFGYLK